MDKVNRDLNKVLVWNGNYYSDIMTISIKFIKIILNINGFIIVMKPIIKIKIDNYL